EGETGRPRAAREEDDAGARGKGQKARGDVRVAERGVDPDAVRVGPPDRQVREVKKGDQEGDRKARGEKYGPRRAVVVLGAGEVDGQQEGNGVQRHVGELICRSGGAREGPADQGG